MKQNQLQNSQLDLQILFLCSCLRLELQYCCFSKVEAYGFENLLFFYFLYILFHFHAGKICCFKTLELKSTQLFLTWETALLTKWRPCCVIHESLSYWIKKVIFDTDVVFFKKKKVFPVVWKLFVQLRWSAVKWVANKH